MEHAATHAAILRATGELRRIGMLDTVSMAAFIVLSCNSGHVAFRLAA